MRAFKVGEAMMVNMPKNESCAWGTASVAAPIAALLIGLLFVGSLAKGSGGDTAAGASLVYGGALLAVLSLGGLLAAIVSLAKKEKWPFLGIAGILLNVPGVGYGLLLSLRPLQPHLLSTAAPL